jgi:hypothetical protein
MPAGPLWVVLVVWCGPSGLTVCILLAAEVDPSLYNEQGTLC